MEEKPKPVVVKVLLALIATLLCSMSQAQVEFLVVNDPTSIRRDPNRHTAALHNLTSGDTLLLLTTNQTNGYYHVRVKGHVTEGWVYRTFVRRYKKKISTLISEERAVPEFFVHFINVGQGSATLIEFPCGVALIDTGGERNPEFGSTDSLLVYLERFFERRRDLADTIDLLLLTHAHEDHTSGSKRVASRFFVKNVVTNGTASGGGPGQPFLQQMASTSKGKIGYFPCTSELIEQGGTTNKVIDPFQCEGINPIIKLFWGRAVDKVKSGESAFKNPNNHSVVTKIEFGKASLLITGDLEVEGIEAMMEMQDDERVFDSDVYVVGHHGAENGTTQELLGVITPEIAVLSFGSAERHYPKTAWSHGHPRAETIRLLEKNVGGFGMRRTVRVSVGPQTFETQTISKNILGVGWGGTLVLSATSYGIWTLRSESSQHGLQAAAR